MDTILSMSNRNFREKGSGLSEILSVGNFSITTGRSSEALQGGNPQQTDRRYLPSLSHSFTLDLPDFRWALIPGTETVRASGRFPNFSGFRLGNGARPDPNAESDENWPENKRPLELADFELAIFPVTVAQFRPFMEQGGYQNSCYWSKTGWRYRGDGPGWWKNKAWTLPNHPVIGVIWYAVQAYCNWLNDQLQLQPGTIRLPTEAEWEWAVRGPEGRRYPWGEEWDARRCNSLEAGLDCTSAVGCFPHGVANWWKAIWPEGEVIHDLVGNIWEWTASEYSTDYSKADWSVLNPDPDSLCVLRGGSWGHAPAWLRGAVIGNPYNKTTFYEN